MDRGAKATYVYQKNPYEKAIYNVGGLQWRTLLGKKWNIHLEAHGASSSYENVPGNKFSGSAEFRYRGDLFSGLTLNGSGYYSDAYFPGSRKGTVSLAQGVSTKLSNDIYIGGSVGYNRTAPKSYAYDYTYRSENSYANATLSLPKLGRISSSLYYRHQGESSPSYASYLDAEAVSGTPDGFSPAGRTVALAKSQRGSPFSAHWKEDSSRSVGSGRPGQMKTTLNYSWQWFMAEHPIRKGLTISMNI